MYWVIIRLFLSYLQQEEFQFPLIIYLKSSNWNVFVSFILAYITIITLSSQSNEFMVSILRLGVSSPTTITNFVSEFIVFIYLIDGKINIDDE